MSAFEKQYYESQLFWEGDAVADESNIARIRRTAELIPADSTSLVDIGCGNGVFVNHLQLDLPRLSVYAIDRSQTALSYVKTRKIEGDIASLPLADKSFDCVTCLEVIEHLPVDIFSKALSELTRVAAKYIVLSVPFAENLEKNHTQCPQCMSVFNADLHMRSFSEGTFSKLLVQYGFRCDSLVKAGKQLSYRGHHRFERIFYPSHFRSWRSPICPICGFTANGSSSALLGNDPSRISAAAPRRSVISYFTKLPKLVWPKDVSYYWIIGLYTRS